MFGKVRFHKGVSRILGYNELKEKREKAECVLAKGFVKDLDCLSPNDKLFHFERLISLNDRARTNALHISLSFFPEDKLSDPEFKKLIREYMQRIGFGNQPYLAYRHNDTRHPHFHIVSTNIRGDGSRMESRTVLQSKSLKVTQEMEVAHGLRTTEQNAALAKQQNSYARKIEYGESALKPSIQNVLSAVVDSYKYRSFDELNAVLGLYNVRAYKGQEGSRLRQYGGLLYGLLDEHGKSVGVPLKASSFEHKPTLKQLEKKFVLNEGVLAQQGQRVKTTIDWTLAVGSYNLPAFQHALEKEGISTAFDRGKTGQLQHIYYIDHQTKNVFDGETLGVKYGPQAIREICSQDEPLELDESLAQHLRLSF